MNYWQMTHVADGSCCPGGHYMLQPAPFPERLARVVEMVRSKTTQFECSGSSEWHVVTPGECVEGIHYAYDPLYAALRNVLMEDCPCHHLTGHPVFSNCDCSACLGTGYIPRRVWQELREQGIKGALAGAVATIEEGGIGYVVELDVFDLDDPDIAALEAVMGAIG